MTARAILAAVVVLAGVLPASLVSAAGSYPQASTWSPQGSGVSLDAKILIGWTMRMDTASVEDAFSLTDGLQVFRGPLEFTWTHTTSTPFVSQATPRFALNSSTTYHATVLATATDASKLYPLDQDGDGAGGEVTDALAWEFTTEDAIPPRILSTLPAAGATDVPVTTDVFAEFSEAMDEASVSSAFLIAPSADGVVVWGPSGADMTLSPGLNLQYGTQYTASVAGTARDLAGNLLDGDGDGTGGDTYVFRFTTEPDVAAPQLLTKTPPNGAMSVSVSAIIDLRFSETMLRDSVAEAISLTDGVRTWTSANGSLRWSGTWFKDDAVVLDLYENFPFSAGVTVTVNASIARDPAGFYLDGDGDGIPEGSPLDDVAWSFTTEATDTTPPAVLSTRPSAGATNVLETTDILLTFGEPMVPTNVESGFALVSAPRTWTKMDGTFSWSQGWDEVRYVPSANLAFATSYAVRLAGTAMDVSGNPLDGDGDGAGGDDFASGFETRSEPDVVPPTVVGTLPADGASAVVRRPRISITFDDAMNPGATAGAISMAHVLDLFEEPVAIGAVEWFAAYRTVSFDPLETLDWDASYRVTVSQAAKDDAGLRLATSFSFVFRTARWSGHVIGIVLDGANPLPGATVTIDNRTTQTNESGAFAFEGVEEGTYTISISKEGYEIVRLTRTFSPSAGVGLEGRTIDLGNIALQRSDLLSPVAAASLLAAALAALLTVGLFMRRRRRSVVHLDDLEAEEGEVER